MGQWDHHRNSVRCPPLYRAQVKELYLFLSLGCLISSGACFSWFNRNTSMLLYSPFTLIFSLMIPFHFCESVIYQSVPNQQCQQMVLPHFQQGVESSSILKMESNETCRQNGVSQSQAWPDRMLFYTIWSDLGKVTLWSTSTKVSKVHRERKRGLTPDGFARSDQQFLSEGKPLAV